MTTERDAARAVRSWLQTDEHESAERVLGLVLDSLDATPQRRPRWRWPSARAMNGTFRLAAATTAAVVVIALGGAIYFSHPALTPAASPSPSASPFATDPAAAASPTPTPSSEPTAAIEPSPSDAPVVRSNRVVAYPVCSSGDQPTKCRIWVAKADGADARELRSDSGGDQYPLAWSADGSRLLFSFSRAQHRGLAVTDALGTGQEEFESLCPPEPAVATGQYTCEAPLDHTAVVSISPDGTRAAYQIREHWGSGITDVEATALAILNLSTGSVRRLDSTQTTNPVVPDPQPEGVACLSAAWQGYNSAPDWSPDGALIAFVRSEIGPPTGPADNPACQTGLFTVDVDTGRVSQPDLTTIQVGGLDWSSDGSRMLVHGYDPRSDTIDVYIIRPDGGGLTALTSDGASMWPHWTRDGRVVFLREAAGTGAHQIWILDADGGNATRLSATIPALTAAGCVVCPDPGDVERFDKAYWQPLP
jgi:Tol biopolymer transport system component